MDQIGECMNLVANQKLIELNSDASIKQACQTLINNHISSAPVWDEHSKKYVGMLDYRDIVELVLMTLKTNKAAIHEEMHRYHHDKLTDPVSPIIIKEDLDRIIQEFDVEDLPLISSGSIVDLSRKNPFYGICKTRPIKEAIDLVIQKNVSRINVMETDGRVMGIISQIDIVKYFYHQNFSIFNKTIEELGLADNPAISITKDRKVFEALSLMSEHDLNSVAIVDSTNSLYGSISMADIRFIVQNNKFGRLWMSASHFISIAQSQKGLEHEGKDSFPYFDVKPRSTLKFCIQKMLAIGIHRIWITDDDQKLIGRVSLIDIIKQIIINNS